MKETDMHSSMLPISGEISRQNPKILDRAAGRRVPATGIAAALAASLAILGCPVGGAFAASPTVQVDVVNPATNPGLTRSVDDPGRIAYQSTASCVLASNDCSFDFPAVPKNHRLVVQHMSGFLLFDGSAKGALVLLEGGANNARSSIIAPPSFQTESSFDQPVLQYFDAGSAAHIGVFADAPLNSDSSTTISGYLLDCATTPCAAIAP
jgi:hypothetical protein